MGERSKVYMTDLRCRPGVSLLNKLEKLMRTAGIWEINFERKLVAIKMHFGEPGTWHSCGPITPRWWPMW